MQPTVVAPQLLEQVMITDPAGHPLSQWCYRTIRRKGNINHGSALLDKYAGARHLGRLTHQSRQALMTQLSTLGRTRHRAKWPSSGLLAIDHFIRHGYHVHIVGFGFTGWKRHPWELEKRFVEQLSRQGQLSYL